MGVYLLLVDACGKERLIAVWQQRQQCFRHLLSFSPSLVADAAACCLHVGMANAQWCGRCCGGEDVSASW